MGEQIRYSFTVDRSPFTDETNTKCFEHTKAACDLIPLAASRLFRLDQSFHLTHKFLTLFDDLSYLLRVEFNKGSM